MTHRGLHGDSHTPFVSPPRLKEDAKKVIEALGSKQIRSIRFRSSWVFLTAKGFELPAEIQRENVSAFKCRFPQVVNVGHPIISKVVGR